MQPITSIQKFVTQFRVSRLVGKVSVGVVVGLLMMVVALINAPQAHAATVSCSRGDRVYSVVRGDTLSAIAQRYKTNWPSLAKHNRLANPNLIYVEQTICIPAQQQAASQTSAQPQPAAVNVPAKSQAPAQQQQVVKPQVQPQTVQPQAVASNTVAGMIQQVFGPYGSSAVRVATCESGLNPNATNTSSSAAGLFQFLPSTWAGTSQAGQSPYNAYANIQAAHEVFVRDGYSWREWSCQP